MLFRSAGHSAEAYGKRTVWGKIKDILNPLVSCLVEDNINRDTISSKLLSKDFRKGNNLIFRTSGKKGKESMKIKQKASIHWIPFVSGGRGRD